ncbi:STAS domain-containing protein [Dactylosporangium sp. NPDC050688]|uniref:STAS domain-containing protein n=1 Tax=Dactylosporangium sp. NPDC050688 TaxID=3157217 RepID=UPI0033C27E8F
MVIRAEVLTVRTVADQPASGVLRVAVAGVLDEATAPDLRAALDDAVAAGNPAVLEVDVAGVTYCSLAGLRVFGEVQHRFGGTLQLLGMGQAIRRLLDLQQRLAPAGTSRR